MKGCRKREKRRDAKQNAKWEKCRNRCREERGGRNERHEEVKAATEGDRQGQFKFY